MTTDRRGFWESEDAYVRRAADQAVSAAAGADARLLRLIRASDARIDALAARVDVLSKAFDAFLEASDVRREAEQYGAAAAVRAFVRTNIGALTNPAAPLPSAAGVVDVPGYWLPPAVIGVIGLLGGEGAHDAAAAEHLAEASRRDAYRTAVFVVSVLHTRGLPEKAEPWLSAALPLVGEGAGEDEDEGAGAEVTLTARCLWLAYGAGVHGAAGSAVLREWLGELAASVDVRDVERAFGELGGRPDVSFAPETNPRSRNLRSHDIENGLRAAAIAAADLGALLAVLNGEPRPQTDAQRSPAPPDLTLESVLTSLVEEGSGPEADLLRRAAELELYARRSGQSETGASPQPRAWDASVGAAADLLVADLTDTGESAAAARRTAALTALARPIATFADKLLARTAKLPAEFPVSLPWQQPVTLAYGVPFDQVVAGVHGEIDRGVAAESAGAGRKQAAANQRRAVEQKQAATERLRDASEVLAGYRRRGEEIHAAAKVTYDQVMGLLGRHAEGSV